MSPKFKPQNELHLNIYQVDLGGIGGLSIVIKAFIGCGRLDAIIKSLNNLVASVCPSCKAMKNPGTTLSSLPRSKLSFLGIAENIR